MKNDKKVAIISIFLCTAFITCCMFPFLNITKEIPIRMESINWIVMVVSVMSYHSIGQIEVKFLANKSTMLIISINLVATIVGMICRFMFEFGEVSNTYNFTIPNIVLQVFVGAVFSSVTWMFSKKLNTNQ